MDLRSLSETNFGLLLKGETSPTRYNVNMFYPPYDRGFHLLQSGKGKDEIINEIGLENFQAALHAGEALNGATEEIDWAEMLETSAVRWKAADDFERMIKRLRNNEEVDWTKVQLISSNAQKGALNKFITLEEVWDKKAQSDWQKSGLEFIDRHIGGWPKYGVTIIAAPPKEGKTSLLLSAIVAYVKAHKKKNVGVFSIEMMTHQLVKRLKQMEASGLLESGERERIFICDEIVSPEESINWAATLPDLGIMFVDFADLMVAGEVTEPKMSSLYRTLANGAKALQTSIILISQLSGRYEGGIPRAYHVRYTRLAEALSVMILMLYVPYASYYESKDDKLPEYSDAGYIIKWFSRYDTKTHAGEPQAILVDFDDARGWKIDSKGEDYSDRL